MIVLGFPKSVRFDDLLDALTGFGIKSYPQLRSITAKGHKAKSVKGKGK